LEKSRTKLIGIPDEAVKPGSVRKKNGRDSNQTRFRPEPEANSKTGLAKK